MLSFFHILFDVLYVFDTGGGTDKSGGEVSCRDNEVCDQRIAEPYDRRNGNE